ncbi:hypothetical protein [Methylogaea oryzae]|uniref:Uncharacterized protein n=1 Tax=Methylogaea oryzae TaxID=1295382 RepID=A0A8D4VM41_9GAMM|nr:hypothetical protein [Methylogaea oryzae]BBL70355.1 hypothetical protein MoryE10_09610 [Methylogaea oryzae]
MKNPALEEIKAFAQQRLSREYGYCGVADSDDFAMLNSGGDGENIKIVIEHKKDEG